MKRIPESYKSASVDSYAREIAVCRCGGSLHFSTDMNGYVIESCDRCKVSRQMTRAPRREELDPMPLAGEPKVRHVVSVNCSGCPMVMIWEPGRGPKPKLCPECRAEKTRTASREAARQKALKRKAA